MASSLIGGQSEETVFPPDTRAHYGFTPEVSVRVIQTRHGIMLIPMSDEPPSEILAAELDEWEELGAEAFDLFPFVEQTPVNLGDIFWGESPGRSGDPSSG